MSLAEILKKPIALAPIVSLAEYGIWRVSSELADRLNIHMAIPDKRSYASNVLGNLDYFIDTAVASGANNIEFLLPFTLGTYVAYKALKKVAP